MPLAKQVSPLNLYAADEPLEQGMESSTLWLQGARSDPQKDADFPIAMGNKQHCHEREVLGCCSCFQKKAVDGRKCDLLPDIQKTAQFTLHIRACTMAKVKAGGTWDSWTSWVS